MTERLDDPQRADKPSDPMATPLTDEEVETAKKFPLTSHGLWVSAEFARDLERQLTDAQQRINEWRDICAQADRRYSELELTSSAAISALVTTVEKAERPTARSAGTRTAEAELLDKAIMALSGEYVEKPDDAGEEWNAAVGYCIGALRTMREQLPGVALSASEAFRPSAAAVAKAREYMDEPEERNRVKANLGRMGRMVNGKTEEGELLSSIIDDGEVLAREILRLDRATNSPSDRNANG